MRIASRLGAVVMILAISAPASPQSRSRDSKWEVEVHGGAATTSAGPGGTQRMPQPGAVISTPIIVNGQLQRVDTRIVPSWYFGDGAAFLNQGFPRPSSVSLTPLDPALRGPIVDPAGGGVFGLRIARKVTSRLAAEFSFDQNVTRVALSDDATQQIEASRASFASTWNTILGVFAQDAAVTSVTTLTKEGGRQSVLAGTLLVDVGHAARIVPYAAVGAGLVRFTGDLPSAGLTGDYRFRILVPPGFPFPSPEFHQTDVVTITSSARNTPAAVVGGGVRIALSPSAGIRVDVRDHLTRNTLSTVVDAKPTSASAGPGSTSSFVLLGSNPVLQISNNSTSTPSTLSDETVTGFKTFEGSGIVNRVNLSVGLYWRF